LSLIIVEISDRVGTITMNYEAKRNALAEQMVQEIADTLHEFERQGVRVVILRGQPGIKVWSSGHNVAELPLGGLDPLGWQDPLRMIIRRIESYPGPVIALVEGGVWGGACELVFACDLVIATPEATFAATPAKLGVPYNATGLLTFPQRSATAHRQGAAIHRPPDDRRASGTAWHRQSHGGSERHWPLHPRNCRDHCAKLPTRDRRDEGTTAYSGRGSCALPGRF
jgi:enoyl-CoA hydratase/carnithine racemase